MSDMQDDAAKLDNFEHFRVVPHKGDTISYRIEGRRVGSDSYEPVLDQGIKKGSGPMKGFAGMTKAPFLTATDMKRGALQTPPPSNRIPGSQGQSLNIPKSRRRVAAPQQSDDERMSAMTSEGGREPPPRTLAGGTHGGLNMYSPLEQKQLTGGE
jgi:hypothetical protein